MQEATSTTGTATTATTTHTQSAQASTSAANDDGDGTGGGNDSYDLGEPTIGLTKRRNALTPESADIGPIKQAEVQEKMSNLVLPEAAPQRQQENKS